MTPEAYCQDKAARSGSSFYYSFRFLPPARRAAITALYAFCREVDDVVDEEREPSVARVKLQWWRAEVSRMYDGQASHPVTRALGPHLAAYGLEQARLLEIIDGMEMDLDRDRYPDFETLALYCHRVAGVVGLLAARIFGASLPQTDVFAERLGLAFQLTNIIRDVGEDARRGRIYLPREDLEAHRVTEQDLLDARPSPELVELLRFEAQRARTCYREAFAALPEADLRSQRPSLMMAAIYARLLDEIERDGFRVLERRIALTPIRKLWLAWRTWWQSRLPRI
ncbi:MAG: presqualene diphosphate synthase HpnD [Burkholderiaceae bacterium]|nr:presqualene diphosphate synthase HpnD [Burkholderiaceae bacterium]